MINYSKRTRGMTTAEFWERVSPEPNTGCWIWVCSAGPNQYGVARVEGLEQGPHRHALESRLGRRIRRDRFALHRCGNRWCVNPQHLYEGTQSQNMLDAWRRPTKPRKQWTRSDPQKRTA